MEGGVNSIKCAILGLGMRLGGGRGGGESQGEGRWGEPCRGRGGGENQGEGRCTSPLFCYGFCCVPQNPPLIRREQIPYCTQGHSPGELHPGNCRME